MRKKILKQFFFFLLILLIGLYISIKMARGSFKSWKTINFSSLPREDRTNGDVEEIKKLSQKYPELYIQNTLIDICMEATDETVYSGRDPYRMVLRFWTLDDEKSLYLKSIQIINEDLRKEYNDLNYKTIIKKRKVLNGKTWVEDMSDVALDVFYTPYDFYLSDYNKDITVKIAGSINEEDFELIAILKKYSRKGFIQWGY